MANHMENDPFPRTRFADSDEVFHERMTPSKWLTLIAAVLFIGIGVVGFVITGVDDFAEHNRDQHLLWFEINPLHNVVHLALGILGLALFQRVRGALTFGVVTAVAYAGAFIYGLLAIGQDWDVLSLNWADNWLHLSLAVLGAAIAALAGYEMADQLDDARAVARQRSATTRPTGRPGRPAPGRA